MIDHKISDHLLIKSKCSSVPLLNEPLFLIVYAWGWVRSISFKGYKMKPKLGQKHASSIAWWVQVIPLLISFYSDHVEEVRAIIQRAAKDIAIESSLKTYEEVWLSKIFELKAHIRMKGPSSATAATHDVSMFFFSCCSLGFLLL